MKPNTIYTGECAAVMETWPDECIDLVVTSPPYDNLRDYNGYTFDFEGIADQLARVLKPGGVIVWVVGDATINGSETGTSFRQALYFMDVCGLNLHDTMMFRADRPPKSGPRYQGCFEYMFVFSKGAPNTFNPIKVRKSDHKATIERNRYKSNAGYHRGTNGEIESAPRRKTGNNKVKDNIWFYRVQYGASDRIASNHPAIFPEALARDHIISWSNPGDLVLDPMCGSGTTLKMAKETGRKWVGIEISSEYVKLAEKRVRGANVPLPLFAGDAHE